MQKTVVVRVDRLRKHAKYKKYHRTSETFKAHVDDAGAYRIGDVVEIEETRPLSRDKRWRVRRVVRGNAAPAADTETDDPSPTIL